MHANLRNFVGYDWHAYELDSFRNSISREFVGKTSFAGTRPWSIVKGGPKFRILFKRNGTIHREKSSLFSSQFLEIRNDSILRGYFQSWKYAEPVSKLIESQLRDLKNPSDWYLEQMEILRMREPWIGVHVRLGNYLNLPTMGVTADIYYRRALELLRDLGHSNEIVIFTDSPTEVSKRNIFGGQAGVSIFESKAGSRPIETLLLMSMAAHLIIANSTFSWWAGWLGRQEVGKRVIYPRPWIDLETWNDRDLHLPGWIGLSRERALDYTRE